MSDIDDIIKDTVKEFRKNKTKRADPFHKTRFAKMVQGKPLWIEDEIEHEKTRLETGQKCCFCHIVGLPEKEHLVGRSLDGKEIFEKKCHPMYDYEMELYNILSNNRYVRVKKATGMGITTFILYFMVWSCVRDDRHRGEKMVIVTGPRQDLANEELDRLVLLFQDTDYTPKRIGDKIIINHCTIQAYPSHTFDTARGLDKCRFFFVDEADFFPPSQINSVMTVLERYEAKSHPYVILNSTTNLPTGLYAQMDKGKYPRFKTVDIFHERGIGKIYTQYEIEEAKKMPSFAREYCGQYGVGEGNIFPYQLVDAIIEEYDLALGDGLKVLAVDPAYGSSNFAIVGAEKIDGITYIKEAIEFDRPAPSAMVDRIIEMSVGYSIVVVDSSDAGLVTELTNRNVSVYPVSFRKELSQMTMDSSMYVKEKKVRIHPAFQELIYQLKSVRLNERGNPDKESLLFDLGDAFFMAINYMVSGYWFWVNF